MAETEIGTNVQEEPLSNDLPDDQKTCSAEEVEQLEISEEEIVVEATGTETVVVHPGNGVEGSSNTKISKIQMQVHKVSEEVSKFSNKAPQPVEAPVQKVATVLEKVGEIPIQKIGDELSKLIEKAPPKVKDKVTEAATIMGVNLQEEPINTELTKDEKASSLEEMEELNEEEIKGNAKETNDVEGRNGVEETDSAIEAEKLKTDEVEEKVNINEAVVECGNGVEEASDTQISKIQTQIHKASEEVSKFSDKAPEPVKAPVQKIASVLEKADEIPIEKIVGDLSKLLDKAPPKAKDGISEVASKIGINL